MSPQINCPACGNSVDLPATACPACGSALESQNSPTIMAVPTPRFGSSAEAMDEVKRLLRAGKKMEAIQTHRTYFSLSLQDAQNAVNAIESDLNSSVAPALIADDQPPSFAHPEDASPAAVLEPVSAAGRPAWQKWALGCSIALVLFCCLCVILPVITFFIFGNRGG